eukprot:6184057-Pleurochrysis_carterae.AAC.1
MNSLTNEDVDEYARYQVGILSDLRLRAARVSAGAEMRSKALRAARHCPDAALPHTLRRPCLWICPIQLLAARVHLVRGRCATIRMISSVVNSHPIGKRASASRILSITILVQSSLFKVKSRQAGACRGQAERESQLLNEAQAAAAQVVGAVLQQRTQQRPRSR